MRSGWLTPHPGRFTPNKDSQCPLYRRLGGSQGCSERVRKILPPPRFDPRTVQPLACRYTDWAIPARRLFVVVQISLNIIDVYEDTTLIIVLAQHVCKCRHLLFNMFLTHVLQKRCALYDRILSTALFYYYFWMWRKIWYDMIYLLTAIGLSPGGRSTVNIYTQTIHRTIRNKQYIEQQNNFGRVRAVPRLG